MKLLIMQFFLSYVMSILCQNIFLGTLFSNTFSICHFLSAKDQVSHPYKTTGPLMVLYFNPRRMRCVGNEPYLGDRTGAYRVLVGKPRGRRPLERGRYRLEDNIKMDIQEVRWGAWTGLTWLRLGQGAACGECSNKPSGSIKWEFVD
jgi:hypothetical protein